MTAVPVNASTVLPLVGLRREPKQDRSRARVEAIINALVELVGERVPSELTTTDVAERAGVPIGSLYEYFEDLPAIVDAAVARMLDRHDELLLDRDAPAPRRRTSSSTCCSMPISSCTPSSPDSSRCATRRCSRPHHRQWLTDRVEGFLDQAGGAAAARGVFGREAADDARLGLIIVTGDAMLQRVFRDDPRVIRS